MAEAGAPRAGAATRPGSRGWLPPLLVLALAAGSWAAYQRGPRAVAEIAIFPYAASLVLGPSLVYPWLRRAGAGTGRAVAASLIVPALWLLKECYRVAGVFSTAEALYYASNPLSLGLLTGCALQMALGELCLERARGGRWRLASGAGLVVAAVLVLAGAFVLVAGDSGGRDLFYAWIALYRRLFPGA